MATVTFTTEFTYRPWKEFVRTAEAGSHSFINFAFPDGLAEIPIEQVIEVYNWVFEGATLDTAIRDAMLPLWLHGYLYQKHDRSTAALAPLCSPGIRFRWPRFENWVDRAIALNVWPERWREIKKPSKKGRAVFDHAVLPLLDQFIAFKIFNRRDAEKLSPDSLFHRRGWDLHSMSDQDAALVAGMEATVVLGDWRTYPPFFPGDLTTIRLKPRASPSLDGM